MKKTILVDIFRNIRKATTLLANTVIQINKANTISKKKKVKQIQ